MSYILLIEDNLQNSDLVVRILTTQGFTVKHASLATKGLAMVRQECPILIFLDLKLPDMRGETVARIIYQQLGRRTPPIVAISGYDDGAHRQSAKDAGCRAFITKPVTPEELIHTAKYFIEPHTDVEEITFHSRPREL